MCQRLSQAQSMACQHKVTLFRDHSLAGKVHAMRPANWYMQAHRRASMSCHQLPFGCPLE